MGEVPEVSKKIFSQVTSAYLHVAMYIFLEHVRDTDVLAGLLNGPIV